MRKVLLIILVSFTYLANAQTAYLNKVNKLKYDYFVTMGCDPAEKEVWEYSFFETLTDFQTFLWKHPSIFSQRFLSNLKTDKGATMTNNLLSQIEKSSVLLINDDIEFYKKKKQELLERQKIETSAMVVTPRMISDSLTEFKKKREFEKTEEYYRRISPENLQLSLKNIIDNIVKFKSNLNLNLNTKYTPGYAGINNSQHTDYIIRNYDADSEKLNIEINNSIYECNVPPQAAKYISEHKENFYLKPNPGATIVVSDKGDYCYTDFILLGHGESEVSALVRLKSQAKPLVFNLKEFDEALNDTYNFTESFQKESLKNRNLMGIWFARNNFIYLKPGGSISIEKLKYDENAEPDVKFETLYDGQWEYADDKLITTGGSTINRELKNLVYQIASLSDNKMVLKANSGDIEYTKLNHEQLQAKVDELVSQLRSKQAIKGLGNSLLKSILK